VREHEGQQPSFYTDLQPSLELLKNMSFYITYVVKHGTDNPFPGDAQKICSVEIRPLRVSNQNSQRMGNNLSL
jgi:hypothetical protein